MTIIRSLIHIFARDGGAQSIATIPLAQFPSEASDVIVLIFAYWGISQLIIGILYLIISIRYQSLIPFMYLITIFEYVMRLLIARIKPIITTETAPGAIGNYVLPILCLIMFFLSFHKNKH